MRTEGGGLRTETEVRKEGWFLFDHILIYRYR